MSLNHINSAKILMDVHSSSNTCTNFSIRYFRDPIKSSCIKANESIYLSIKGKCLCKKFESLKGKIMPACCITYLYFKVRYNL